jgi:hypothetical protein
MPKQASPHYHKYECFRWPNGKPYYKCMLPNCPHYLPVANTVIGRESLCWGPECNHLVTLTREDVTREIRRPMCEDCKNKRKERKQELSSIL